MLDSPPNDLPVPSAWVVGQSGHLTNSVTNAGAGGIGNLKKMV